MRQCFLLLIRKSCVNCYSSVKMGRKKRQNKRNPLPYKNERNYSQTSKDNALFKTYYAGLGLLQADEVEAFYNQLKEPLAVTFRITGYKRQAKELLKIISTQFFDILIGESQSASSAKIFTAPDTIAVPTTDDAAPSTKDITAECAAKGDAAMGGSAAAKGLTKEPIKPPKCMTCINVITLSYCKDWRIILYVGTRDRIDQSFRVIQKPQIKRNTMREEKLTGLLSKWGCFQTRLFAMMAWPIMFRGFQTMLAVVILAVPLHRCRVPGLHNDTYAIQSDSHRALVNASIPVNQHSDSLQEPLYDRCKIYVNSSDHVTVSDVSVTLEEVEEYRYQQEQEEEERKQPESMACSDWVYDDSYFESTVITQFHLVCEQKVYRAHFSMIYMVGGIVSGLASGFISDWMGRKKCFFMAVTVNIVAGALAAFPQHPLLFLLYRFFIGVSGYAIYLTFYIIGIEFVGPEYRNFAGTLGCLQWMLGTFLLAGVSFLIRQWHILQLFSSLPLVVCFIFWRYLPESPIWLLSKAKTEEAMDVLKTLARVNRLPFPQGLDSTEDQENPEEKEKEEEDKQQKKRLGLRQVLNFPVLIVRGLILAFIWFALGMTYYGISINVTNLFGNAHVNFLISNTVEAIGYLLCWFLADRIGRTRLYCVAMVMSGTFCSSTIFTVLFLDEENQWATTVLALAGKLGVCAAFSVVYLMTSEMMPTVFRHTGMGCFQLSCRLGSAISPYIADLVFVIEGEFGQALPFILFGVMAVTAGLLSLLLPETLRCPLPDTLEEAAKIGKRVTVPAEHGIEMNGVTDQGSSLMNGKEE